MLPEQNEWQIKDEDLDCLYPWYTNRFLNFLKPMDFSKAHVLEFGGGHSTIWWAYRCKYLKTVESDAEYIESIKWELTKRGLYVDLHNLVSIDSYEKAVINHAKYKNPVVIIDGINRDECCDFVMKYMPKGTVVICDNWNQEEVWIPSARAMELTKYKNIIFKQDRHPHWKTAIFWL